MPAKRFGENGDAQNGFVRIREHRADVIMYIMSERKIVDESFRLSRKRGTLRREVWIDETGKVTRYNLAYINHELHQRDNGRVVGYDNAHGAHHGHYFGVVTPVAFVSFEDIETQFERDWVALGV